MFCICKIYFEVSYLLDLHEPVERQSMLRIPPPKVVLTHPASLQQLAVTVAQTVAQPGPSSTLSRAQTAEVWSQERGQTAELWLQTSLAQLYPPSPRCREDRRPGELTGLQ